MLVTDCHSHLVLAAVPGRGPGSDLRQFKAAVKDAGPSRTDRDAVGGRRLQCRVGPRARPDLRLGSALRARTYWSQCREIIPRVISHNVMIVACV